MNSSKYLIFLLLILFVSNCSEKPEADLLPPVISLDSGSSIYTVKIGREVVVSPTYAHVTDDALYVWHLDGKVIGREPTLSYSSSKPVSVFITLQVTTRYGQDEEELRIDVVELDKPVITLAGADDGFMILSDSKISFSPSVSTALAPTYSWKVNGELVGKEKDYVFSSSATGTFVLSLIAENEDGCDTLEFLVKVCSPEDMPFTWNFDKTEYNMSSGRTIRLLPVDINNPFDATYTWWIDGRQVQEGGSPEYRFTSEIEGAHTAKIQAKNSYYNLEQELRIHVCPKEGTYYRSRGAGSSCQSIRVYEFLAAPGQFVNEYYDVKTNQEACVYAEERFSEDAYVSLGGFGGYVTVGFDHSVDNDGDYNIAVTGNSFDGSSEPGIVWVMQDENGDGLPNDTWYELKGSEYGLECTTQDYAVTYYRPKGTGMDVLWTDNRGNSGSIDYLGAFHTQDSYYPNWVEAESYTLRGTCLESRNYDSSGTGTYWINPNYGWGYADNFSSIDRLTDDDNYSAGASDNHFKISDAVTYDGQAANLKYVDFVKVQVGVNTKSGWLGEVSTEVFGIKDFNMTKKR